MDLLVLPFTCMEPPALIHSANNVSTPHGSLLSGYFSGNRMPPGSCHRCMERFFRSIQVAMPPVAFDVICDIKYSFTP